MNKKGFTLTEILIVLVVAGILLALILPNMLKAIQKADVTAHRNNLHTVQSSLLMCFTETRVWSSCGSIDALTNGKYLDAQFTTAKTPFGVTYSVKDDPNGTGGKVSCYSGGTSVPAEVSTDTSLIKC